MSWSTIGIHDADDANNRSYVTRGDKLWAKKNEMICNQYKPNISVFPRDTVSIKDNKMKANPMKPNIVSTEKRMLHLQMLLEYGYIWMENSQREN